MNFPSLLVELEDSLSSLHNPQPVWGEQSDTDKRTVVFSQMGQFSTMGA